MQAVLRLVEHLGIGGKENVVRDFADVVAQGQLFLGHGGLEIVEGRQAVQEDAVRVSGLGHQFLGDLEGGEQLHPFRDQVFLAHGGPDVGIEGVRALQGCRIVGAFDDGAGLLGHLGAAGHDLIGGAQLLRAEAHVMHAQLGADIHQAVGDIVAGVAAEHQLALIQRLGDMLFHGHDVGQGLGGMIHVGETVEHGHAGILGQVFHHLLVVTPVFDAVEQASQHLGAVHQGFLFAHLGGFGIQEGHAGAFVHGRHFEGAAGAGGGLFEQQHDILALEELLADALLLFALQLVGQIEKVAHLLRREIHDAQKAASC